MNFSWIFDYRDLLLYGALLTCLLLAISVSLGFALAILLAVAQVGNGLIPRWISKGYCTFFRGTPLLIQLWLIYYGLGSYLPYIPGLRTSFLWPVMREGLFFAALALTLNFAAYQGEILRGAMLAVPKGELEAARAVGMSPRMILRRIWLPRAIRIGLPTFAGEVILQLKATPIVFSVTVMDLYGAAYKIRQDTLLVYEPLLLVTVFYVGLTFVITQGFQKLENAVPVRR
ncbi:polar amino acid transport system permease protein [Rhizobium leguminosarum]|uniref:Polar amino acid transport system permease protein n=1 Tax=Rhizobium leguminosarum TaxID=384 RepID=A0AAE2MMS2_RHILE|nr:MULTISPECIES: ABC transporter permease subunit [Rhizobium]MBB4292388.1 polar amino acid transport system permease protein [Rhizobium leguminosarum]MBB4298626.1 polar amino acid transport system permease protein [Rhizobium leguminosarum]MBB4310400.1 polar amino acid transport system permease protein [Rhizobium leguminosarum]MBB4434662.1 polar amino acid transport system permease protein [Rhizobium esperanzae]MBB4531558.1 polar amino acid transport system permease protein [Rhizobium leguminos